MTAFGEQIDEAAKDVRLRLALIHGPAIVGEGLAGIPLPVVNQGFAERDPGPSRTLALDPIQQRHRRSQSGEILRSLLVPNQDERIGDSGRHALGAIDARDLVPHSQNAGFIVRAIGPIKADEVGMQVVRVQLNDAIPDGFSQFGETRSRCRLGQTVQQPSAFRGVVTVDVLAEFLEFRFGLSVFFLNEELCLGQSQFDGIAQFPATPLEQGDPRGGVRFPRHAERFCNPDGRTPIGGLEKRIDDGSRFGFFLLHRQ